MILARKSVNNYEWECLHRKLDRAITESARVYSQKLAIRHVRIRAQKLSDELDELRLGREPDYDMPGLPLVYALKYMPRRVVSIFGSLLSVLDDWHPRSVLDIGSGTGAMALALDLLNLRRHISLTGVEPSREMILFSESSRQRDRVSSRYTQGSIVNLGNSGIDLEPFDLVVFSACFPYSFDDWSPLLAALGDYEGRTSKMILVVEPDAKHDILMSFQCRLAARGWPTVTFCCHDLPDAVKDDTLPLSEMSDVWRRLGLDGSPKTWWNPPDDKFLVANPKPTDTRKETLTTKAQEVPQVSHAGASELRLRST